MPSSSKKQHNFMAAVAHSPSFAKKVGVPQRVGKDFTNADKGKKMSGKIDWSANEANAVKGGEKSYLPKANKRATPKNSKDTPGKSNFFEEKGNGVVARAMRSGLRPGTREFSEFIGSDGKSNTRDAITAKAKSQGVKFDKYGRVKMAEGGDVSDEDTMSENAKQNIHAAVNKPVTTKSEKNRGFFGKIFKSRSKNVGPDGQDWKKLGKTDASSTDEDEETESQRQKRLDVFRNITPAKKSAASDIDVSGLKVGPDTTPKKQSFKEAFAAAKGKNFEWNGKKYSGAKKSDSSASTSTSTKSHRTTGAGQKSFKSAYSAADAASDTAREGRRAVNRSLSSSSSSSSGSSRFLANAAKDKKSAAESAFKKNPKGSKGEEARRNMSNPNYKEPGLEESHPEDLVGAANAVGAMGTAAMLAKKLGPKAFLSAEKIAANVGKRAARGARSEAFINETARKRAVSRPLKQAQTSRKAAHAKYEADNKEAYRGMKRGGSVSRYCGGSTVKAYAKGGMVSSRADGIASRGRTKCKIV
jgi:hypothetical protein